MTVQVRFLFVHYCSVAKMEAAAQFSRAVDLTRLTYLVRIRSEQYLSPRGGTADAPVLGTGSERSVGSSPTAGTIRCIRQCIF